MLCIVSFLSICWLSVFLRPCNSALNPNMLSFFCKMTPAVSHLVLYFLNVTHLYWFFSHFLSWKTPLPKCALSFRVHSGPCGLNRPELPLSNTWPFKGRFLKFIALFCCSFIEGGSCGQLEFMDSNGFQSWTGFSGPHLQHKPLLWVGVIIMSLDIQWIENQTAAMFWINKVIKRHVCVQRCAVWHVKASSGRILHFSRLG